MSKQVDPKEVELTILTIINNHYGIKLNDLVIKLCHGLMVEDFDVNGDELQTLVYAMIKANLIAEIIYIMPEQDGRNRSFLLPIGTVVTGNIELIKTLVPTPKQLPNPQSNVQSVK